MLAAIIGLSGGPVIGRVLSVRRFAAYVEGVTIEVTEPGSAYPVGHVMTYSAACVVPLETGLAWRPCDWRRHLSD